MNKTAKIIIAVLVVCVVGLALQLRPHRPLGGTSNLDRLSINFLDVTTTSTIAGTSTMGSITATGSVMIQGLTTASSGLVAVGSSTFRGALNATGSLDTVTAFSCGTSPTIIGSNGVGQVITGTALSSTCTIVFGTAFPGVPRCFVNSETTSSLSYRTTSTAAGLTIKVASSTNTNDAMNANTLDYFCVSNF